MHVLAGSVIRQSLIPMLAGYLVVMVPLALALFRLQRAGRAALARPGAPSGAAAADRAAPATRRGWLALLRHAAVTALGGYLLLVAVDTGYYYGIAKVGGDFLASAVTGPALLIGLAAPVFAAASWLSERRRRRGSANDSASGASHDTAMSDGDGTDR